MASGYEHCPKDIRDAIAKYDADVKSGAIVPWNPDVPDTEYDSGRGDRDGWLAVHMAGHVPFMYVTTDPSDRSVRLNNGMYLDAPQM